MGKQSNRSVWKWQWLPKYHFDSKPSTCIYYCCLYCKQRLEMNERRLKIRFDLFFHLLARKIKTKSVREIKNRLAAFLLGKCLRATHEKSKQTSSLNNLKYDFSCFPLKRNYVIYFMWRNVCAVHHFVCYFSMNLFGFCLFWALASLAGKKCTQEKDCIGRQKAK